MSQKGNLVVVSAPSGTGKSTVCKRLRKKNDDVAVSISYTTRDPRGDEKDGVEYHFVDDATFDRMITNGAFLEWAPVHDRRYGSAKQDVQHLLQQGLDVLFDIDVQGGRLIKQAVPEALLVFLLPPSIDELMRRLVGRSTESEDQVRLRFQAAVEELRAGQDYDCHVLNDSLEQAVRDLDTLRRQWRDPEVQKCRNFSRADEALQKLIDQASARLLVTV